MSSKKSGGTPGKKAKKQPNYLRLVKPRPFGQRSDPPAAPEDAPSSGGEELIHAADFQTLRLSVTLLASRAETSDATDVAPTQVFGSATRLRPGSKAQVVNQISLSELLDNGVVLDVPPPDFYQEGQVVFVLIKALLPSEDEERAFSANARVERVSSAEDGALSVYLAFLKADPQQWNEFRAIFSDRQREINEFLLAARGR